MQTRGGVLAVCCALAFGCVAEPQAALETAEAREIIENLRQAGFPADDIAIVEGRVYVGQAAEVWLAASREMLMTGDSSEEQYRTTNTTRLWYTGSAGTADTGLGMAASTSPSVR